MLTIRALRALATTVVLSGVLATSLTGCAAVKDLAAQASGSTPAAAHPASVMTGDYYSVDGKARLLYSPEKAGNVQYCRPDSLKRAVCAYGLLTSSLREAAQARGREDLDIDPAGWSDHDAEVTIPALPGVAGSRTYHGWLFNRSHLLADSLGGDAVHANLVTGTRTQNVGSTHVDGQYAGGMAYTERIARQYLDTRDGNACPLYYAATAHYTGQEMIPRTVTVDMRSCDKSIDTHVIVYNTAQGFSIDYTTGTFTRQ